ncbi:MOSC N-terminal beta barrel domain-containing protein [Psychromonas arctica]|nr:MOSC N-terminal beta barrel domain-containing protein [Psychromonas arctica]
MQSLTDIYIYPIKSTKGIQLPQALVEEKGLGVVPLNRRFFQ